MYIKVQLKWERYIFSQCIDRYLIIDVLVNILYKSFAIAVSS